MAKTREKRTVYTGVSSEQMEQAFAEYAKADARLQKIQADMDIAITRIREKHQEEIAKLQESKDNNFEVLQAYAMENKADLFTKKRSLETIHGVMGFRTGTPKLKTLKGYTWAAVTNLLVELFPSYTRRSVEPCKDLLLADRDKEDIPTSVKGETIKMSDLMAKVGIKVEQDESFFVEPKKEE